MLRKRTKYEIITRNLRYLVESGRVTNVNPGSVVRTLLEIMSEEIGEYNDTLQLNTAMGMVPFATGPFLDYIGDGMLATPRWEATKASVAKEDKNVKFFVDTGALIDIIPSGIIPEGTIVSTADGTVSYTTTDDVLIDNVQTEVFAPVVADQEGVSYNVGAGALVTSSIAGPNVTNLFPIGSGLDTESDSNYRYRISNAVLDLARANLMSIRLAALSVPGVADAIIRDHRSGVGTFDVLIIPTGNIVARGTMRGVQSAVANVKAVGVMGSVTQPRYVPVELLVQMYFTEGTPDGDKPSMRQDASSAMLRYIGEINMGQTFVLNELRQRVMDVSDKVYDIEVLCYRFRRRAQLLRNFTLESDELFVPDPQAPEPLKAI